MFTLVNLVLVLIPFKFYYVHNYIIIILLPVVKVFANCKDCHLHLQREGDKLFMSSMIVSPFDKEPINAAASMGFPSKRRRFAFIP